MRYMYIGMYNYVSYICIRYILPYSMYVIYHYVIYACIIYQEKDVFEDMNDVNRGKCVEGQKLIKIEDTYSSMRTHSSMRIHIVV